MWAPWVGVALAAASPKLQVAAPDLGVVDLDPNRGALYSEHLAQQLTLLGLDVVSSRQIAALLGQERQKALLGCGDSSCTAELANALGAEAVVTGSVAKLGSTIRLSITIVSGRDAKPLSVLSGTAGSEDDALELITRESPRIAKELIEKLRPGTTLQLPRSGLRRYAWIPGVLGALSGAIGLGLLFSAWSDSDTLNGFGVSGMTQLSLEEGRRIAEGGAAKQTTGGVMIGVGLVGLAAAAVLFVIGPDIPAQIVGTVSPTGASFGLTGRLP